MENTFFKAFSLWAREFWWNCSRVGRKLFPLFRYTSTILVFFASVFLLKTSIPFEIEIDSLNSFVQLLVQVLALIVGVLLIGTTVSFASYDRGQEIIMLHDELGEVTNLIFDSLFLATPRYKLDRPRFLRWMFNRVPVKTLRFYDGSGNADERWFIYRPNWDGVWYRVAESPFAVETKNETLHQIQLYHESVICAFRSLEVVERLRSSKCHLVTKDNGSNGSKWFLDAFEEYKRKRTFRLPATIESDGASKVIALALQSEYYVREEFENHSKNANWAPHKLTQFQVLYADFAKELLFLVTKLQLLRLANIAKKSPGIWNEGPFPKLNFDATNESIRKLKSIRPSIVSVFGASSFFHTIKVRSLLGILVSFIALLGLLGVWPVLATNTNVEFRIFGFVALYSLGIAAFVECFWFLAKLVWSR